MMSKKWIDYFLRVTQDTAQLSSANRLKVGCVIVRDKRIILCGYNGTPSGEDNQCEDEFGKTLPNVLHAEENAILYAANQGISLRDSSIFINYSPCLHCSRMIFGSGIKEVYFQTLYRNQEGLEFLNQVKIPYHQV